MSSALSRPQSGSVLETFYDLEPTVAEFRDAVLDGLSQQPKTLPCKFFYDAAGSVLFDRICELAEYYPTRTENTLLAAHAANIAALAGPRVGLIEFGSGAGTKIRLLLAALERPASYTPVDISREHLLAAAASLADTFPDLHITPVCADYTGRFDVPDSRGVGIARSVGFFPGSTIGNFTPDEAERFLTGVNRLLGPGSMMIVGVDRPKDAAVLEAAYDDAEGVTAAFNRNLLVRINRELGGDFDLAQFDHRAVWNAAESRVEMHLVSRAAQSVSIMGRRFAFARGESIHTENSYKYAPEAFVRLAGSAGYETVAAWSDPAGLFGLYVLQALPG